MNSPSAQISQAGDRASALQWRWALPALVVGLIAVSSQSLWIDEAVMAAKSAQPTLSRWWHSMLEGGGLVLPMPLYMFYLWIAARMFGIAEWTLRAANIPWFVVGFTVFMAALPKERRLSTAFAALFCPFAWYYLDEARPYAMQVGASLVMLAALRSLAATDMGPRSERFWVSAFWIGGVALCASNLLGVIWCGAAFAALIVLCTPPRLFGLVRRHWMVSVTASACLAALAAYYAWAVRYGSSAVDPTGNTALTAVKSAARFRQGVTGGSDLQNFAFIVYELLGFSGLGPSRLALRAGGANVLPHYLPMLGLYAAALGPLAVLGIAALAPAVKSRPRRFGTAFMLALLSVLPLGLLMLAGHFLGFRILGRHCAPLISVWLLVVGAGIHSAFRSGSIWLKAAAVLFVALSLCSCLSLRYAQRHRKDDYRDAAAAAKSALARGMRVWWSAADDGANYYGLPLSNGAGESGRAILVLNATAQSVSALPQPDIVISSKPDLYDNQHAVENFVRGASYRAVASFPAFTVYERR